MNDTSIKIPSELFALAESSHYDGKVEIPLLSAGPDDYTFSDPVSWWVDITNTGSAFLVSGKAEGRGTCSCSRCLEKVVNDFFGDIEG